MTIEHRIFVGADNFKELVTASDIFIKLYLLKKS
ncbi:hypothetical protein MHYMCMPSP_01017 [Hyalomma marginatum]|uniref:Uncharacterized protein n=1 Tax=Hyalomma marginatum TaxID=34627 RepID=A0A8S4C2G8_9ACAR|nr:hypothetical protein MHYMCMPSP_01017 [Hyalomma marginatum]CAG7597334.1 hypothetical protein MHYMCMPASI_00929 [Hyalomma marginatum]